MNIRAINNEHFSGKLAAPVILKNGSYTVNLINDSIMESHKGGVLHKKLRFSNLLGEKCTDVYDNSIGIKSKIRKDGDSFMRRTLDNDGIYISEFHINKNPKGGIDTVTFYDPIDGKSEVVVRDSKGLEALRAAFKNYNEHIKRFYK